MNLWPFHKPERQPLDNAPMRSRSGQFAASPKTMEQCRRRGSVNAQLGIYAATIPLDQRRAETEAYWAAAEARA